MLSDRCPVMSVCPVCNAGVLWPKGWMDQDETWHAGRPQPGRIVLGGDPAHPHAKGHRHQFLVHICCGQMAGCIKMPVGMEVSLGPGAFVFDGDPAHPCKRAEPPNFRPMFIVAKRLGCTWHEGGPRSRPHCARWGPSSPHENGAEAPNFWPISIVAKWLDASGYHLVQRQASA